MVEQFIVSHAILPYSIATFLPTLLTVKVVGYFYWAVASQLMEVNLPTIEQILMEEYSIYITAESCWLIIK